ncbi:hypothetical protein QBC41DRAFT_213438 [Cercophora samala]|uniref:Uncharacterized protein n=1 Tax=Cercophora samala TaxID=330535 RepID=A0AA40DH64_9PEZI|nr:hypothetical protein QBC41DRAFT_213438 [Cercophora samala]
MAGKTFKNVAAGLISSPKAAKSPDSDVSPRTTTTTTTTTKTPTDYFTANKSPKQSPQTSPGATIPFPALATASSAASTNTLTSTSNSAESGIDDLRQASNASGKRPGVSRKSSTASVTFRPPRNPSLPQGAHRKTDIKTRLREASPEPVK